jgi:hypothetical protein
MATRNKEGSNKYHRWSRIILYLLLLGSFSLSLFDVDRVVGQFRKSHLFGRSTPDAFVWEDHLRWSSNSNKNNISELSGLDDIIPTESRNNTIYNNNDKYLPNATIWALVTPPGLLGGYRNQVIRMFGLVLGAKQHNVQQLLLPTLLWSTTFSEKSDNNKIRPVIPMEALFDIDHWNSFHPQLPRLVSEIPNGDCWSNNNDNNNFDDLSKKEQNKNLTNDPLLDSVILGGKQPRFLTPIANITMAYLMGDLEINPFRFDVSPHVQHCQHPVPYGMGGGRGQLWVNYMTYSRQRQRRTRGSVVEAVKPDPLERSFLQALKPLPQWRQLGQHCVIDATRSNSSSSDNINKQRDDPSTDHRDDNTSPLYIAVHPRIELEMMGHACGTYMNKNLTRILQDVAEYLQLQNNMHSQTIPTLANVSGVFVAFSRQGASMTQGSVYRKYRTFVDENINTMNRVLGTYSLPGQGIRLGDDHRNHPSSLPVFECGERLLQTYYESLTNNRATTKEDQKPIINYGSLLSSVINFQVAVEATAFVGMRCSSWSNSVWTTRYYLGRGESNLEYTRERGIQPVENGGLPAPHQNCDGIKDPGR